MFGPFFWTGLEARAYIAYLRGGGIHLSSPPAVGVVDYFQEAVICLALDRGVSDIVKWGTKAD